MRLYPTVPQVARQAVAEELEIEIEPRVELVGLEQVSSRRAGQRLENVSQLLECLRENTDLF